MALRPRQGNPLIEEVSNILDTWQAFGPIRTGVKPWPLSGIFNPTVIRAYQQHVRDYQLKDGEQHSEDMGLLNLFLKMGDELCGVYSSRAIAHSSNVQSEQCEGAVVFSPESRGTSQLSLEMFLSQRGTTQLGDKENPRSFVNGVYQQCSDIIEESRLVERYVRKDIEAGLPLPVQTLLEQVIALHVMDRQSYTDYIVHYVQLHRKRVADQEAEDLELQRKLDAAKLTELRQRAEFRRVQPAGPRHGPENKRVVLLSSNVCRCQPAHYSNMQPRTGRHYTGCFSCGSLTHLVKDCTVQQASTLRTPGHTGRPTLRSRCDGPQVLQFSPRGGHFIMAPAGGSRLDRTFRSASTTGAYKTPDAGAQ